mgnify:CR=1 FL=1
MILRIKGAFIAKSTTKFTIIDYLIFMLFATASFTHAVGMLSCVERCRLPLIEWFCAVRLNLITNKYTHGYR